MEIKKCNKLKPIVVSSNPKFGTLFTPHLLKISFESSSLNHFGISIEPNQAQNFLPSTVVFHYGQGVFEGLKAFRQADNSIAMFRPDLHIKRFIKSCERLAMPTLSEEILMRCLKEFTDFEKDSIPLDNTYSLYLRPMQIASDHILKVGASQGYVFYIIACIVGTYFAGNKKAKVFVNPEFVRAFPGGLGEAKTLANYAASLRPQKIAETNGCDQVLYLDGIEHDLIDELGGMNFFIVKNGELLTPELNGSILHGITRKSILEISQSLNLKAREEKISWSQTVNEIKNGIITEAFACGTAAVIQPISEFYYQNGTSLEVLKLKDENPITIKLNDCLTKIQRGQLDHPNWLFKV